MKFLRNGKVLTAIGFVLLMVLIWFVGPFMGLETSVSRLVVMIIVLLVWVAMLMIGKLLADRAGSLLERMLRKQADDAVMGAKPENRTDVSHLRKDLLESIETLKKSNLGKTRGKAALYELPWYMIIGHPAAGKSSAIQCSGLTFPFADKNKAAVRGVGGTRNCDWFFTSESVLIDTAGRYATQNEDRGEWIGFLKLLKRYRPRTPINGIILTISFPELVKSQTETFAVYARQVRQRINEIDEVFGVKVPVYLFFTKIDLLGGFTQFFEDFTEEERARVWGSTLSHEQGKDFDAARVVGQHFDTLMRGLAQMGMDKLSNNRGNVTRPALFAFPIEFNAMRESVCSFMRLLFEDDPYHTKPLLRGFYFTSALQEGIPQIHAGTRVSAAFDLSKRGFESSAVPQSQSYFLRDTFREVLIPDQHLVGRQTRPSASHARVAGIAAGLVGLALLAAGWTWSFVGNQKLIAMAQTELVESRKQLASSDLLEKLNGLHKLQLRLEQLYKYRIEGRPWEIGFGLYRGEKIERALRAEYFDGVRRVMLAPVKGNLETKLAELNPSLDLHAPPAKQGLAQVASQAVAQIGRQSLKWVAQGNSTPTAPTSARDALQRLQARDSRINTNPAARAVQPPAVPEIAANPQEGQARLEEYYNALKTYLMLKMQPRMEVAHLSDQLPRYWRPWLQANKGERGMADINKQAERIVAFYVSQLKETDLPLIENHDATISNSREILRGAMRRLSAKERIYNELKARGNTQYAALTVGRILENRDADTVAGSYAVPGAYTREAWDKYFKKAILDASKGEIKGDDWVLATSLADNLGRDGDVERNRMELEALYKADYVREWRKFLQGLAVSDFPNLETASVRLGKLGDTQQSPIKKIVIRAAYETAWDNPSELQKTLETTKNSVLGRVMTGPAPAPSQQAAGEVGGRFIVLAQLAAADPSGRTALSGYLDSLLKLKGRVAGISAASEPGAAARQFMQVTLSGAASELAEALQIVDGALLGNADQDTKDALRPLLVRPLMATYAALIPPAETDINRLWAEQVWAQWVSLSGKYPFADSSNEAQMVDIAKFLRPGEGTLPKFIDRVLGTLVVRRGDTYQARTWANMGVDFNPGFLAGISRLTGVANAVLQEGDGSKFELQPVPTPGLSEITIEIDGQQLRYRNGPQAWTTFSWPAAANQPSAQGARLNIVSFAGVSTPIANHAGRLGLMRLLAQAHTDNPNAHDVRLEWRVKSSEGRTREDMIPIRFNFRMVSGANPIALSGLRRVGLPEKIAN